MSELRSMPGDPDEMSEPLLPIPEGLTRCPTCGEFVGTGLYLSPPERTEWETVTVSCVCQGLQCERCGSLTHEPVSNYYNERDGVVWHVPHFSDLIPCKCCGAHSWRSGR